MHNIKVTAICFLFFFGATACGKKEQKHFEMNASQKSEKQNPSILMLGDSLFAGYNLPPSKSPSVLIQQYLALSGLKFRVINASVPGDTTEMGLSRLPAHLLPENQIQFLVIELGLNDAYLNVPPRTIEKNLRDIIRLTKSFDPAIRIVLLKIEDPLHPGSSYSANFNSIYTRVSKDENTALIPFLLSGVIGKKNLLQTDGFHPNIEGNQIMTEHIWEGLRPILTSSP